ncbi:GerAB/ArcD/ProY family transporter [Chengkuizengella sediminis]|uniref:GerAB/ArcD/ProY family transporter n=1 Tax=Chengkuizengella sediminis TaxID=1885917 RepID=UPI0013897A24|nr:endospore germination permease [Chengkuizengella sediminis]NDI35820.1 endospore germination permease [Chengkuizengella sediminis]
MNQQQIINMRQLAWIVAAIISTSSHPRATFSITHQDAGFTYILPLIYVLFITFIFYELAKAFPGKNIFHISFEVLGNVGGGIINGIIIIYIWLMLIRHMAFQSAFIDSTLLELTPRIIILLIVVLVLIYYGRTSFEVILRVNDILFPMTLIITMTLPILLSNKIDFSRLTPILSDGVMPLIKSNFLFFGGFSEVFILGAFLHALSVPRQIHSAIRFGGILSFVMLTLITVLEIVVLGPSVASKLTFPFYLLAGQIEITDFLERMEVIVESVYTFSYMISMVVMFISLLIGLSSFSKRGDHSVYSFSIGWFVFATTVVSFENITEMFSFNISTFVIAIVVQIPILILLFIISKRKKYRMKKYKSGKKEHRVGRKWRIFTNGLLFISILFIALGITFGQDYIYLGFVAGTGYAMCMISALITSLMEMKTSKQLREE